MIEEADFVVVGGGIAGASIAAHLAEHGRVRLIEMEEQPGYHSTGRSAALFTEAYGNAVIRTLTRASRDAFYAPPASFCAVPLVQQRDVLIIAHEGQEEVFEGFAAQADRLDPIQRLSTAEALALFPILRPEALVAAGISRRTADIEVHELHQAYLRMFRTRGGILDTGQQVVGLERDAAGWTVTTNRTTMRAVVVVNAAGAWAGQLAAMAGASDIGLRPLKRTACLVPAPEGMAIDDWPMLLNVEEEFYLKPDAGMLLLSPADEGASDPCDAQADELDIAIAVDRVEKATTLEVRRVAHRWAGLRSFVADSSPVVGYDPVQPGFFWLAALGGYGIQTAPALGRIGAALARGVAIDAELLDFGIDPATLAPGRTYRRSDAPHLIGVAEFQ